MEPTLRRRDISEGVAERPVAAATGNYEVIIKKVANGFILHIGCQSFVSETAEKMFKGLGLYFKDPEAAAKLYLNKL